MFEESGFYYLLVLGCLSLTLLYNKFPYALRSGFLLLDMPVMLVALSITFFFECLSSLLPSRKEDLSGKLVLLTGAGSGIGRAASIELGRQGCVLVLWDVDASGNEETCRLVRAVGGRAYPYTVDVTDRVRLEETADAVVKEYGPVDILVCNAGIGHLKRLYKLEHHEIEHIMNVNFLSIVWLTKFFLKQMVKRDNGHIVCISSSSAMRGSTHMSDYAPTKAALAVYSISLMEELNRINCRNVHISIVYPFFVRTPLIASISEFVDKLGALDADMVAKRIVTGVRTYKQFIYIPFSVYLFTLTAFLCPLTFSNLIDEKLFKGDKFYPVPPNEKFDSS